MLLCSVSFCLRKEVSDEPLQLCLAAFLNSAIICYILYKCRRNATVETYFWPMQSLSWLLICYYSIEHVSYILSGVASGPSHTYGNYCIRVGNDSAHHNTHNYEYTHLTSDLERVSFCCRNEKIIVTLWEDRAYNSNQLWQRTPAPPFLSSSLDY